MSDHGAPPLSRRDARGAVGVVGAGVMGTGVAAVFARAGYDVVLVDLTEAILRRAERHIRDQLRFTQLLGRAGPARGENVDAVLSRVHSTTDCESLRHVAFTIENVIESWSVKEALYRRLDRICGPDCVFAANTSAISITRLGSVTSRPDRLCGAHFMNPVTAHSTVEVIRGHHTSAQTVDAVRGLLRSLGMDSIVVEDMPGFVTNRVLMLMINEAIWLVQDRVAEASDIDRLFKQCFGHRMGPLETADLIGLDTILLSIEVLDDSYRDSKFRPCPLLRRMVAAGLHGRKSGRGFYDYAVDLDGAPNQVLQPEAT